VFGEQSKHDGDVSAESDGIVLARWQRYCANISTKNTANRVVERSSIVLGVVKFLRADAEIDVIELVMPKPGFGFAYFVFYV
jgi:exosome complex RNA-binding protein Csl4